MKFKTLVGRIKCKVDTKWQELEGVTLLVLQIDDDKNLSIIRPIKLKEMELFYKLSFEDGLCEDISSDYDYCIYYLLDDSCELTCEIDIDDLEDVRQATKEDMIEHNQNLEEFKKIHKYYEQVKQFEEEIKQEEIAQDEYDKLEKIKIQFKTKNGTEEIDGLIYKGFGVHNIAGFEKSTSKAITIVNGPYKGYQIAKCSVANYKKLIDEVRKAIGDRDILVSDSKLIIQIVDKY